MEKTTYKTLELKIKLIQETEKIIQLGKANSFDEFVEDWAEVEPFFHD